MTARSIRCDDCGDKHAPGGCPKTWTRVCEKCSRVTPAGPGVFCDPRVVVAAPQATPHQTNVRINCEGCGADVNIGIKWAFYNDEDSHEYPSGYYVCPSCGLYAGNLTIPTCFSADGVPFKPRCRTCLSHDCQTHPVFVEPRKLTQDKIEDPFKRPQKGHYG